MKIRSLLFGTLLFFLLGCGEKIDNEYSTIEEEVEKLETNEDRKNFLEKILEDDQKVRGSKSAELMLKYGKDSKEHLEYVQAQWKQDEINLFKIDKYLAKFGYPKKEELGKEAAMAPWIVIHHTTDPGTRNSYFEILYKAYLTEDIDDTKLAMYLGRTYNFMVGERFQIESPFKPDDEINQLIKELDLEERKAKVWQSRIH